jgi:hypothetical protein
MNEPGSGKSKLLASGLIANGKKPTLLCRSNQFSPTVQLQHNQQGLTWASISRPTCPPDFFVKVCNKQRTLAQRSSRLAMCCQLANSVDLLYLHGLKWAATIIVPYSCPREFVVSVGPGTFLYAKHARNQEDHLSRFPL